METLLALLALFKGNLPPVTSRFLHKGPWCGALMFSLRCAWTNCWTNSRCVVDLRRYDVHVMSLQWPKYIRSALTENYPIKITSLGRLGVPNHQQLDFLFDSWFGGELEIIKALVRTVLVWSFSHKRTIISKRLPWPHQSHYIFQATTRQSSIFSLQATVLKITNTHVLHSSDRDWDHSWHAQIYEQGCTIFVPQ